MKAFYVNYRPICGGDDQQILVIAHDLTQALRTVVVEIGERCQIIGLSIVEGKVFFEGKVIFAPDC